MGRGEFRVVWRGPQPLRVQEREGELQENPSWRKMAPVSLSCLL